MPPKHPIRALSIAVILIALTGCTHQSMIKTTSPTLKEKEPVNVSLLVQKPLRPYQIIGKANISKYNAAGQLRHEATLRHLLREAAASLGGDAIIAMHNGSQKMTGTVIAYKQILV